MQVFLITPNDMEEKAFVPGLRVALETGLVSALLIRRAGLGKEDYKNRVEALRPLAQSSDCAVLLEDCPELVKKFKADGVYMSSGQNRFVEALNALKPQFIVGAGDIDSRHEAMLRGEAGADFILFGTLEHAPDEAARELARWWADLFETPCVLSNPTTPVARLAFDNVEFIGLGENVWHAPDGPAQAIKIAMMSGKGR